MGAHCTEGAVTIHTNDFGLSTITCRSCHASREVFEMPEKNYYYQYSQGNKMLQMVLSGNVE